MTEKLPPLSSAETLHQLIAKWRAPCREAELDPYGESAIVYQAELACADELEPLLALVDDQAAQIAAASRWKQERNEELMLWRAWAQFVYLGGGLVTQEKTDADLRLAVNTAHDEFVELLRKDFAARDQSLRHLVETYAVYRESSEGGQIVCSEYPTLCALLDEICDLDALLPLPAPKVRGPQTPC